MKSSILSLVVLFVVCLHHSVQGHWIKLNDYPVCVGAKGDKFGKFYFNDSCITKETLFPVFKLVHRSGRIRCVDEVSANSKWGCNTTELECHLGVLLTDEMDTVLLPKKRLVKFQNGTLFYELPPFDGFYKAIALSDFTSPICLLPGQELRLWYAEDLANMDEADNHGEICVDVYGYILWPHHHRH